MEEEKEEEEVKRQKLTVVSQVYRRFSLCSDSLLAQTDKYLAYLTLKAESLSRIVKKKKKKRRKKEVENQAKNGG